MTSNNAIVNLRGETSMDQFREPEWASDPVGRFHTWWRGDPLPLLPGLPTLSIAPADHERLVDGLGELDAREIRERLRRGHQPWLARIAGEVVGWGWCASEEASIGELGISCPIPPGNRYLWDFVTPPPWRGRGIYPRLLQTIVAHEAEAERFWLGHDLPNGSSARGIAKAGFHEVGVLCRQREGAFVLVPSGPRRLAAAASALFGLPVADPPSVGIA